MAIKSSPQDFVVAEELTPQYLATVRESPSKFALYAVEKRGLTTHELLDLLAKRLSMPVADVAAAGLKDKHAVTTQHVSVRVDFDERLPPRSIKADAFEATHIGFVTEPIDSRAILGNRFRLVVRNLTRRAIDDMQEASQRLAIDPPDRGRADLRLRITNYFGNQRFGSARAGQGFIAAHLVKGEFDRALQLAIGVPHRKDLHRVKKFKQAVADAWDSRNWSAALRDAPKLPERAAIEHLARKPDDFRGAFAALPYFFQQLTIEAYQSILWNRIATTLLIDRLGDDGRLWVADDQYGQLVFPETVATPRDLIDLDLPLLARKSELVEPWKTAAETVLAEEGISVSDLRVPGLDKPWFGEVPRQLFMIAEQFTIESPHTDDEQRDTKRFKVETSFALPRGGYATVVLRALGQ